MCSNASHAADEVLGGIITTATSLGIDFNLTSNPSFSEALIALKQAQADVENWKQGTAAQNIIQILQDASAALSAFNTIIPPTALVLLQTVLAGIAGVIGTLDGNGTPPAGTTAAAHASDVAAHTLEQVKTIAPNFHYKKGFLGMFAEAPVKQYNDYWNQECDVAGYPQLKVA